MLFGHCSLKTFFKNKVKYRIIFRKLIEVVFKGKYKKNS